MEFHHLIDTIPFLLGSALILAGPTTLKKKSNIKALVLVTTAIYLVAQSSWFTSFIVGDSWGRDFSNYIWFLFNTLTLGIFAWVLLNTE